MFYVYIIAILVSLSACNKPNEAANGANAITDAPPATSGIEDQAKDSNSTGEIDSGTDVLLGKSAADEPTNETQEDDYAALLSKLTLSESGAACNTEDGYLLAVSKEADVFKIVHTAEDYVSDDFQGKKHLINILDYTDNKQIFSFEYKIGDYLRDADLEFVDINFDGKLDIRVLVNLNAYAEPIYENYLWNDEANTFEANQALNELTNPELHSEEKVLTTYTSTLSNSSLQVYEFDGNALIQVASAEYQLDDVVELGWSETISVTKNGEISTVERQLSSDEYNELDREKIFQYLRSNH